MSPRKKSIALILLLLLTGVCFLFFKVYFLLFLILCVWRARVCVGGGRVLDVDSGVYGSQK